MELQLEKALQVRYIKLHFILAIIGNTRLPADKVSALRGGMGEMILRDNCIRDRNCAQCDFEPECIVRRTVYSKYQANPQFVTTSDSIGYLIECDNSEEDFCEGDLLEFKLILFGKTIYYLNQYMKAFAALGKKGIGKNHSKFQIVSVTDTKGRQFLQENIISIERYQIQTLGGYAESRMKQIRAEGCRNKLLFQTPVTLKYQNKFLNIYHMEAIWNAVRRRIYMLECYEGTACNIYGCDSLAEIRMPVIMEQVCRDSYMRRYSSTQNTKMTLRGIKGYIELDSIPEDMLLVLAAGELTHIGKNTSFGFGKYRIM